MNSKIILSIITAAMLISCRTQSTGTPASQPTDEIVPTTQTSTNTPLPTDTAIPPTETSTPEPTEAPVLSFSNDISPILQSRCLNCHGGERLEEGLSMLSYAELMAGSDNGVVIIPGIAENSLLVDLISTGKMPKRGPKLTPPQVQLIIEWINQGAMEN